MMALTKNVNYSPKARSLKRCLPNLRNMKGIRVFQRRGEKFLIVLFPEHQSFRNSKNNYWEIVHIIKKLYKYMHVYNENNKLWIK